MRHANLVSSTPFLTSLLPVFFKVSSVRLFLLPVYLIPTALLSFLPLFCFPFSVPSTIPSLLAYSLQPPWSLLRPLPFQNAFLSLYSLVTTLSLSLLIHVQVLRGMAFTHFHFLTFHPLSTHWIGLYSLLKLLAKCPPCQIQLHFISPGFIGLFCSFDTIGHTPLLKAFYFFKHFCVPISLVLPELSDCSFSVSFLRYASSLKIFKVGVIICVPLFFSFYMFLKRNIEYWLVSSNYSQVITTDTRGYLVTVM